LIGTVAFAVTAREQQGGRHEHSPTSPSSSSPIRLRRLRLPTRRDRWVRWYLRLGLSYRDVDELLTERGVQVDHVIIYR